jgi:hypothetical protein
MTRITEPTAPLGLKAETVSDTDSDTDVTAAASQSTFKTAETPAPKAIEPAATPTEDLADYVVIGFGKWQINHI